MHWCVRALGMDEYLSMLALDAVARMRLCTILRDRMVYDMDQDVFGKTLRFQPSCLLMEEVFKDALV